MSSARARLTAVAIVVLALTTVGVVAFTVGVRLATPSEAQIAAHLPSTSVASPSPTALPLSDVARGALSRTVTIEALRADAEELGTGWLMDGNGDFVTNAHVVTAALAIRIRDRGGSTHLGTLMGIDPSVDIAVVRSNDGFNGAPLAFSSSTPVPGQDVVAVASSRATGHGDVTFESLHALHQTVPVNGGGAVDPSQATTTTVYNDMLNLMGNQIFPGNSGGPVLDHHGSVIGIVTLAGKSNDQAYAIPITRVSAALRAYAARSVPPPAA